VLGCQNIYLSMWVCEIIFLDFLLILQVSSSGAGLLQLTGTTELDQYAENLRQGLTTVAGISQTGLILAVMVTGLLYLISLPFSSNRRNRAPLSSRIARIVSQVSQNSFDNLVDTMIPDTSRMGFDMMESVGTLTNMVSGGVSDATNSLTRMVSNQKLKDCAMQAICYLTPEDEEGEENEEGEGRKNKEKQERREKEKKEKQRRKKQKKNKKKKLQSQDETEDSNEGVEEELKDNLTIESEDCEVFECNIVSYGYTAYKVFEKMKGIKERLDRLDDEKI